MTDRAMLESEIGMLEEMLERIDEGRVVERLGLEARVKGLREQLVRDAATIRAIEREFHEKVSAKVRLVAEGVDRYRVFTPFVFDDGDHLAIVLKRQGQEWMLTDEAHTFMHFTYIDEKRGTHQITSALSTFQVEDNDGELRLVVKNDRYGDALYSFIQALLKVTDVSAPSPRT